MSHDENIEKIEKLEKLNKLEDYLSPYLTLLKYYIEENDDSSGKTTKHHYELYANSRVRLCIEKIRTSPALINYLKSKWNNYQVMPVLEMNEMYASRLRGIGSDAGSDAVFQQKHIDGPFGLIPFFTLIRCIITIHNETNIKTDIKGEVWSCQKGEFFAIDYNRDLHFIFGEQEEGQLRYVLKLHYVMYPNWMPESIVCYYKYLNYRYNQLARQLFLYTLTPDTPMKKSANWVVNTVTNISATLVTIANYRSYMY